MGTHHIQGTDFVDIILCTRYNLQKHLQSEIGNFSFLWIFTRGLSQEVLHTFYLVLYDIIDHHSYFLGYKESWVWCIASFDIQFFIARWHTVCRFVPKTISTRLLKHLNLHDHIPYWKYNFVIAFPAPVIYIYNSNISTCMIIFIFWYHVSDKSFFIPINHISANIKLKELYCRI